MSIRAFSRGHTSCVFVVVRANYLPPHSLDREPGPLTAGGGKQCRACTYTAAPQLGWRWGRSLCCLGDGGGVETAMGRSSWGGGHRRVGWVSVFPAQAPWPCAHPASHAGVFGGPARSEVLTSKTAFCELVGASGQARVQGPREVGPYSVAGLALEWVPFERNSEPEGLVPVDPRDHLRPRSLEQTPSQECAANAFLRNRSPGRRRGGQWPASTVQPCLSLKEPWGVSGTNSGFSSRSAHVPGPRSRTHAPLVPRLVGQRRSKGSAASKGRRPGLVKPGRAHPRRTAPCLSPTCGCASAELRPRRAPAFALRCFASWSTATRCLSTSLRRASVD